MFNIILFSITALVISQDMALYFILTYIVTTKVTDLTIEGLEDFIDVIIVSDDYVKVKDALCFN